MADKKVPFYEYTVFYGDVPIDIFCAEPFETIKENDEMPMTFGPRIQLSEDYQACDVFIDQQFVGRITVDRRGMWELHIMVNGKRIDRLMRNPADEREAKAYFGAMYSRGELF